MDTMDTPKRLTDRKHDAIVEAAITLFQTLGFEGTSMDKVSEAADVSKRTLYNHFPSKEELFAHCCREAWPGGSSPLEPYQPGRPLREQLTRFVERKLAQLSDDKVLGLARVAMMSMLRSSAWAQDLHRRMGDLDAETLKWVCAAHNDGALHNCYPGMAALQLDALITGLALWPQVTMRRGKLTPEEQRQICREIVEMFMARYAPSETTSVRQRKAV
ncbi:MAG: TetR/AcrR family transcriptional regulator [Nevskia sp.]|nr:TetR/AcrR family transcriptional regulator [Nevskia sp.]